MKKLIVTLLFCLFLVSFVSSIDSDSILLKVSLNKGDSTSSVVSLNSDIDENVDISVSDVEGVSVEENLFYINSGESKEIEVSFDSDNLNPGVFVGSINFEGEVNDVRIPIIFGIESGDVIFDLNLDVPPLYAEVSPGGRVLSNVKVFDLTSSGSEGLGSQSVDMFYYIYKLDGSPIVSESENIVVSHDSSFSKTLLLPEKIEEGTYVIAAVVRFGDSYGVSSDVFDVASAEEGLKGLSLSWAIALLAVVVFIGLMMVFFLMLIKDRDKFLLDLKRYHDEELMKHKEFLSVQQKVLVEGGKLSSAEAKRLGKVKLKELRKKQREQKKMFKKMSKKGRTSEMEKILKKWKKKGYNTLALESKLDKLTKKEMNELLKKWKKEGYKNS